MPPKEDNMAFYSVAYFVILSPTTDLHQITTAWSDLGIWVLKKSILRKTVDVYQASGENQGRESWRIVRLSGWLRVGKHLVRRSNEIAPNAD